MGQGREVREALASVEGKLARIPLFIQAEKQKVQHEFDQKRNELRLACEARLADSKVKVCDVFVTPQRGACVTLS
eukprot:6886719-Pyramimonas_sp.AAC.2